MAAGIWNRLTLSLVRLLLSLWQIKELIAFNLQEEKYLPISWDDEIMVRCLEEDDRVSVGMVSESFRGAS